MRKSSKILLGLAAIGVIVGICITFLCKKNCCNFKKDIPEEEEEDLDLDDNLGPIPDREYVPIKSVPAASEVETEDMQEEVDAVVKEDTDAINS